MCRIRLILPAVIPVFSVLLSAAITPAGADVTTVQRYDIDAAGGVGMFASKGKIVTAIAGDKSRTDTETEMKSRVMRTLSVGGGTSSDIVRLDRELSWHLDPKKKQYTEITFEQMRAQMAQGLAALEQMQAGQPGQAEGQAPGQGGTAGLPVSEQNCQWSDSGIKAERTGVKATIAGVETEQSIISFEQTCTDPESGKACAMTWSIEQWLAEKAPGGDEAQAFWMSYAEKMGLEELMSERTRGGMQQLFAMFRQGWDEVMEEAGAMDGYPMKSIMEMHVGGDECTTAQGQPISTDELFAGAAQAGIDAGASSAAGAAGQVATQEATQAAGGGLGGRIAGSAAGAFGRKMASGMFGRFKKKPKEQPAEVAATPQTAGSVRLFRVVTETTEISTGAIGPERFEVPADWTLVETPPMPALPPPAE